VWGVSREATLASDQRVPELIGGVDIRTLPLTALDGFVFSRIDGRSTVSDIVAVTGLPGEQVGAILERPVQLGAARFRGASIPSLTPASTESERTPRPTPPRSMAPRTPPPRGSAIPHGPSSAPPRRRPSFVQPRRMMSESSISGGPPPDLRTFSQRPGSPTPSGSPPVRPRTPAPQRPIRSEPPRSSLPTDAPPLTPTPEPHRAAGREPPLSTPIPIPSANARPALRVERPQVTFETPAPRVEPPASERPLYDPRELDEQVDLPRERRQQILDLYYRLSKFDYYEALGLSMDADKKQIRSAYFALSKAFHPDSMFRKELGSYKAKMSAVFQYLTEAYETLSKKKPREEYDAYLRSTRSIQEAERALAADEVAAAEANVEVPRPPLLPQTGYALPRQSPLPDRPPTPIPERGHGSSLQPPREPPARPREPSAPARGASVTPEREKSVEPREASPEARRLARELLERRLRGGAPPRREPERAPVAEPESPDRRQLARDLTRTLIDVGKTTGTSDRLTRTMAQARAAFERGDLAESVQHIARALALDPERHDIHAEYERLSRLLAHKLADDYLEQAKFEMKHGKWASAALSWSKVCEGRPEDGPAHRAAAFALLKAGGDMRGAQKYAQRAVLLAPTDIDARILLAQIYLTVGLKLNAKRELDAAAKLDPENEMVKNLLSELKA
jgi:curved DNA-binding protein CbpA